MDDWKTSLNILRFRCISTRAGRKVVFVFERLGLGI